LTEALSLFGLWALAGIIVLGIIPFIFKLIIKYYYTTKYAIYFNQKLAYDSISNQLKSGKTLNDLITGTVNVSNTNTQETQNGKS